MYQLSIRLYDTEVQALPNDLYIDIFSITEPKQLPNIQRWR